MTSRFQGLRALTASLAAGASTVLMGGLAHAQDLVGEPTNWALGLQAGVTPLRDEAIKFHNWLLLPVITLITLFVLALLVWVVVRYNKRANPVPARWSHNTPIEIAWTVVPVLILVVIAVQSFKLLYAYHDMPKPDLTIKAIGYQWYWGYEYPDQNIPEFVSNILPEEKAGKQHYKLATTAPIVVPVNKVVRVQVTGADVIHAWAVPAFGVITDAIPGRLNETWFKADRIGTYYGNCRELCGVDHAFMPIEVKVVSQADFDAWVASKGGGAPAPTPTANAAAANAAGAANTEPTPANAAVAAGQPGAAPAAAAAGQPAAAAGPPSVAAPKAAPAAPAAK